MADRLQAALYVRVSTEEQAEEGQSIDAQLRALRAYSASHGMEVIEEFADRGFSATTDKRPDFQRMIALAKHKPRPFDVILIHKQDRFARNREHAVVYKNLLRRECGVEVVSILEPFEDSPQGRLMEGLMEVMAEFYSANLGQEVIKGMSHKARSGAALGLPPLGYQIGGMGHLEVDPQTAPIVRWIFESYAGGLSANAIAATLRREGRRLFGSSLPPYRWSMQGIKVILSNEAYVGTKVWGLRHKAGTRSEEPIRVEGAHEAIIDQALFSAARRRLAASARTRRSAYGDYLLKGMVTCAACGGGMALVMQESRPDRNGQRTARPILACSRYYSGRCSPRNWAYMDEIEKAIAETLNRIVAGSASLAMYEWEFPHDLSRRRAQLEQRLADAEHSFKRQMLAYERGVIDLEELREAKERLTAERDAGARALEDLNRERGTRAIPQAEVRRRVNDAMNALEDSSLPLDARRSAVASILAGASWDRARKRLTIRLVAPG